MGAREGQFIEIILNLLVNQVHKIWRDKDYIISLLSLNITGAFNQVIHNRMIHVLRIKEILEQLTEWIKTFMLNKTSILMLLDIKIEEKLIATKVSQSSPLSPILYLFYAAELLKACNNINKRLSVSIFIDNTTLLAYGKIICAIIIQIC